MKRLAAAALAALLLIGISPDTRATDSPAQPQRPNVLFIAVDDLRPTLGCFGDRYVHSPHIDRLARRGVVFRRAYCQQALCSPSRTSLLTGLRPDTTRVYNLKASFRAALPDAVTLPQRFREHGWQAEEVGKVFHPGVDDLPSWSLPPWLPADLGSDEGEATGADVDAPAPYAAPEVADGDLPDGEIASYAIQRLEANRDRPFFLAVGFLRPHLPFVAPRKYWDLYDPAQLRMPRIDSPPAGAPPFAGTDWNELRRYSGIPATGPLTPEQTRSLIHGYYASVSYMDAQVGRVLRALDRLGLRKNTVVVLWGDHGFHLGDHGYWTKHTNYEAAVRVPVVVAAPGLAGEGLRCDRLVELVDLYPTVCQLCGLQTPQQLEGLSMAPLLRSPRRPWKQAVFTQYPRMQAGSRRNMGYALVTERYRYVEWSTPAPPGLVARELYDHRGDPGETRNLAAFPGHLQLLRELHRRLLRGWQGALPTSMSTP